jgi:hypothetical protein
MERSLAVAQVAFSVLTAIASGYAAYSSASTKAAISDAKLELIRELVTRREFDAHVYVEGKR